MRGPVCSGKKKTFELLAMLLARAHFIWNFSLGAKETEGSLTEHHCSSVLSVLSGFATGGYWLMITQAENCAAGILSTLAHVLFSVRRALATNQKIVLLEAERSLVISPSFGLFTSYTLRDAYSSPAPSDLPSTLLENMRVVNLFVPELQIFLRPLLALCWFNSKDIVDIARRLELFFSFVTCSHDN